MNAPYLKSWKRFNQKFPLGGECTRAVLLKKNLFYLFTNGFSEFTVFLSFKMDPIQVTAMDEFGSIQKIDNPFPGLFFENTFRIAGISRCLLWTSLQILWALPKGEEQSSGEWEHSLEALPGFAGPDGPKLPHFQQYQRPRPKNDTSNRWCRAWW